MCFNPEQNTTPRQQAMQETLEELLGLHGRPTQRVISKMLGRARWNPTERDAAYQETWKRAQEGLPTRQENAQFRGWVCSIARNVCQEMIRDRFFGPTRVAFVEEAFQTSDNPEAAVIEKEFCALVHRYVNSLPEDLQTVIVLRFFEEMSWKEIETCLELSHTEVVGRRRNAALKMLWDNPEFRELAAAFDWIAELVCDLVCTVTAGAPRVTITFLVLRTASVTVSIYDGNRSVCRLDQQALLSAGPVSYTWAGQKADRSMASAGPYRITVDATDRHGNEQKPGLEHTIDWPAVRESDPGGPDTRNRQHDNTTRDTLPPAAASTQGVSISTEPFLMNEDRKFSTLSSERKRQLARQAVSQWRQEVKHCPPVEDIVAFADGTLTPVRLGRWWQVRRHLRHCTLCQVEVARLQQDLETAAVGLQPIPRWQLRVALAVACGLVVVVLGGVRLTAWHNAQLRLAQQEATAQAQQAAQRQLAEQDARARAQQEATTQALHKAQLELAVRDAIIESLSELAQLRQQMASAPAAVVEAIHQVHAVPLRPVAQRPLDSAPYPFVGKEPKNLEAIAEGLRLSEDLQAEYDAFLTHWATLFADLGDLLLQGGKVDDALQVFAYLRQKNPAAKELLFALGELLKMSGQHEQAIKVYDDMIARGLAADDPRVWHFAGWSTLQLGPAHCQSALRYYDQALTIARTRDPQRLYPKLFYNLAKLYHSCDLPGLRADERERLYQENLQRALDLTLVAYQHEGDDNPRIPFTLAILYADMGKLEQALEELERAVQKQRIYRVRAADPAFAVFRDDPTTPYHARFVALLDRYRPPALGGFGARLEATFDPSHFSE